MVIKESDEHLMVSGAWSENEFEKISEKVTENKGKGKKTKSGAVVAQSFLTQVL